jgi:hypothetical protein
MKWTRMKDKEPVAEQVHLVFSPAWGYQTLMWESKPSLRDHFWNDVTFWAAFEFLPKELREGGSE